MADYPKNSETESRNINFRFNEEPGIKQYEIREKAGKNHFRIYLVREEIKTGKIRTLTYICDEVRF